MSNEISNGDIIKAIGNSSTMKQASESLGMSFSTFRRKAKKLGLYKPNQGRKGIRREYYEDDGIRIPLSEILEGKFPFYSTTHLKRRLLKCGIFENVCSICELSGWLGNDLVCQLDHIDGDSSNHKLGNLRMLCPNCHSQTITFSSKKFSKRNTPYTKEEFFIAVSESKNYSDIKKKLNLSLNGNNNTIKNLMLKYGLEFNN
jgi:hypothetical protein